MRNAVRIHLKLGKLRRKFILMSGPKPRIGDACTINGQDWEVVKIETVGVIASVGTQGGKLREVFP